MYKHRYRAPAAGYDFMIGDFTVDQAWHNLDLGGIVPNNASGIFFHIIGKSNAITPTSIFDMKPVDDDSTEAYCKNRPQVANVSFTIFPVVGCTNTRVMQYRFRNNSFTTLNVTVKGWWAPP